MSLQLKMAKGRSLGYQGDPGLFGTIGKAIGGLARSWLPNIFGTQATTGQGVSIVPGRPAFANPISRMINYQYPKKVMGGVPMPALPNPMSGMGGMGWGGGGGTGSRAGLKKDGTPRRVKNNGQFWKRPSMNFANGRAIRRASRRLEGAEKMFKKVFTIRHGGHAPAVHLKSGKKR